MRKWLSSHLSQHCYIFVTEAGNALAALGNINEGDSHILKWNWSKVNHLYWLSTCLTIAWHDWYMINVLSPWWQSILLTTTWYARFTDEHVVTLLAENTIYSTIILLIVAVAWHDWYMITMLSPCWQSILLTTTWHVWYTDEHVVTLLAEHTILLPGRYPHINFHVCVLHLTNIHTIVSSLKNLLGIPSLQQLAFILYHGGYKSRSHYGSSKGSVKVSWEWEKA